MNYWILTRKRKQAVSECIGNFCKIPENRTRKFHSWNFLNEWKSIIQWLLFIFRLIIFILQAFKIINNLRPLYLIHHLALKIIYLLNRFIGHRSFKYSISIFKYQFKLMVFWLEYILFLKISQLLRAVKVIQTISLKLI